MPAVLDSYNKSYVVKDPNSGAQILIATLTFNWKKWPHLRHRTTVTVTFFFYQGPKHNAADLVSYRVHRNHRQPNNKRFFFSYGLLFLLIVYVG